MFEAMDSSGSALHNSRSIPWQVVESRVESVLWQEDGRVALHIIIALKRGSHLYTKNDKRSV